MTKNVKNKITDVFRSVIFELFDPGFELEEGLSLGDIVDNDGNTTVFVVYFGDGFVLFLTGGVPDLVLDFFVFEGIHFFEVYCSKGRFEVLIELDVPLRHVDHPQPSGNPDSSYRAVYSQVFFRLTFEALLGFTLAFVLTFSLPLKILTRAMS